MAKQAKTIGLRGGLHLMSEQTDSLHIYPRSAAYEKDAKSR